MRAEEFHLVLHQPVIPQNTGSIARLCACTGATLDLIHPLGFAIDEASVKRAGLDYWPHVRIVNHASWEAFLETEAPAPENIFFFSKLAKAAYSSAKFPSPVYLVFGSETQGLPKTLWEKYPERFYQIPMRTHLVRSLNLSQCAAVVLYEALRQADFQTITDMDR